MEEEEGKQGEDEEEEEEAEKAKEEEEEDTGKVRREAGTTAGARSHECNEARPGGGLREGGSI